MHWELSEIEITRNGSGQITHGYLDIAVSKTQTPSVTTATTFLVYQIDVTAILSVVVKINGYCDYDTMGTDFWGLWLDCDIFGLGASNGTFEHNFVLSLDKTSLYNGSGEDGEFYLDIPTDLGKPAFRLSSATEDGTPDAEFLVATDAGYGGPNTGLTTCAFTNTHALPSTTAVTPMTCALQSMPVSYADPNGARQEGTSALIDPGAGTKMLNYIGGRLYLSQVTLTSAGNDGIWWAIITPQLSVLDPSNPQNQVVENTVVEQNSIFNYSDSDTDTYDPSFVGTEQGDADLVFNYSSSSSNSAFTAFPSIVMTARRASDAPNFMEPSGEYVIQGINPNGSGRWGDYSACSLDTNMTSRGLVWCGGEYGGPSASASGNGWDTWIYALQS